MFLRHVPKNAQFLSGDKIYTKITGGRVKDKNGNVIEMHKNIVVELITDTVKPSPEGKSNIELLDNGYFGIKTTE